MMKKRMFGRLGVLLFAAAVVSAVVAAVAPAAGPPGGTPPGQSGTPAGQVTLSAGATPFSVRSFQFGAGVGISGTNPPVFSKPEFSEFTFTKGYDSNSVVLLNDLATKTVLPKVVLTATWDSGATLTYELTNAAVSGDSVSSGGGQPSESFSLHYTSVKWTFTDASGTSSGSCDLTSVTGC
jgi:type VI secretion system secreted protein Hcp